MLLERTIFQLDIGPVPPEIATQLGQMGYLQWLGAVPGQANYVTEAMRAYERARPFMAQSPALAEFGRLLLASLAKPAYPLALVSPRPSRRGGAKARRLML